MSYNKTVWHTGDVVHADQLNNIEEGINSVDNKLEGIEEGAQVNKVEGIQFNGSDLTPDTETKKVNISAAPYNQAVPLPQQNDEGKILGYEAPTEGARPIVGWVEKPSNGVTPHIDQTTKHWMIGEEDTEVDAEGKNAYQVYVASVPQGETPMTESQWLASLKGEKGDNAVNPFKGIYGINNKPTGTFTIGDYLYAPTSESGQTGNTIWKWNGTDWQDSGETPDLANGETFASSETLQEVAIDDSHLVNPVNTADSTQPVLAQADDVMQLKAKLDGVTASETKVTEYTLQAGVLNANTKEFIGTNGNARYTVIPVGEAKRVRFLGVSYGDANSSYNYGFGFYNSSDEIFGTQKYEGRNDSGNNVVKEYVVDIPEGAVSLICSVIIASATLNESNFYCYLQSGESVLDKIEKTKEDILDITTEVAVSPNLLNPSDIIVGYRLNEQGSAKTVGDYTQVYGITDYIPIPPEGLIVNHSVKYVSAFVRGCCIYSDKNESSFVIDLAGSSLENGKSLAVNPSRHTGWNYARFSLYNPSTPYDGVTDGYGVYKGLALPSTFQPWFEPYNAPKEQQFKTGEKIGSVSIINDLTTGGVHDAASAESVKKVNSKISEINYTEDDVELVTSGDDTNVFSGYVKVVRNNVSIVTSSTSSKYLFIPLGDSMRISFLAGEKSSNSNNVGFSLGRFNGEANEDLTNYVPIIYSRYANDTGEVQPNPKEYIIDIPNDATHAVITIWGNGGVTLSNFYCKLYSGKTLEDYIKSISGDNTSTLYNTSSSLGNICIHAAKEHNFDDGTPPVYEWFLVQEAGTNKFYYSKDLNEKKFLFTFSGQASDYQFGILSNGDIIAVKRAESLNGSTQSDDNRVNPYIWIARENWEVQHEIDFEEALKPCGWQRNSGLRILPNGDVVFCEYTRTTVEYAYVWKITGDASDPLNWETKLQIGPVIADPQNGYKHFHCVAYDFYYDKLYVTSGDNDAHAHIWYSNDHGENWVRIPQPTTIVNGTVHGQVYRMSMMSFTKDKILWATDTPGVNRHAVYVCDRDSNGKMDSEAITLLANLSPTENPQDGQYSSYGQALMPEYNSIFLFDRQDGGGTQANHLQLRIVDLSDGTIHNLGNIDKAASTTQIGFRTKFSEWYPINGVIRVGFGFDSNSWNQLKVCGNTGSSSGLQRINNLVIYINKNGNNYSIRFTTLYI